MLAALKINGEKRITREERRVHLELPSVIASALPTTPPPWKDGRTATPTPPSPNFLRGRQIPRRGRSRRPGKFLLPNRRIRLPIQQKSGFRMGGTAPGLTGRFEFSRPFQAVPGAAAVSNSAGNKVGRSFAASHKRRGAAILQRRRSLDSESGKRRHGPAPPPANALQLSAWQRKDGAIAVDQNKLLKVRKRQLEEPGS